MIPRGDFGFSVGWAAYRARIAYSSAVNPATLFLVLLVAGGLVAALGASLIRSSGANTSAGRRLAGAPAVALPELIERAENGQLPRTPVRVEGRVRCADPLTGEGGDPLALVHRDVEVQDPSGYWRTVERLRDARIIDLWQRSASVQLDLTRIAEPLIAIPRVWEGSPDELDAGLQPAIARLAADGPRPHQARSTTRQVMLVDHLIVLADPAREPDGRLRLDPPPGGYLVSNVELDVAMRLLAGPNRARMLAGFGVALVGVAVVIGAAIALGLALATA